MEIKAQQNCKPVRLLRALEMSASAIASDQKDKLFTILGLTLDGKIMMPVPSYSSEPEQVCLQATLSLIRA